MAMGGGRLDVTPERVASSPYAQMLVRSPHGDALMLLGNDDDGLLSWYSPLPRIVFLRDGLLAGSAGFPADAEDIRIVGDNPFLRLAQVHAPVRTRREYDWSADYRFGVEVTGELRRIGEESVEILGRAQTLVRFEEELRGPDIAATNLYWAEPATGFILRSRQWLAPGTELELVQLKPYRGTTQ